MSIKYLEPATAGCRSVDAFREPIETMELEQRFGTCGGFDSLVDEVAAACSKQFGKLTEDDQKSIGHLVLEEVERSYREHNSPWWSDMLKADMQEAKGYATTQAAVLDEAFSDKGNAEEVAEALRLHGPEVTAEMVASGNLLDSRYEGNFSGYTPRMILSSWRRVGIL